jgi:enoyl-CoA hydratase/carnithine racemase
MSSSHPARDEGPPLLDMANGVATITLRRPSQRNSLHDADLHALLRMFEQLDADASVRVVILGAQTQGQRKPVFSAGYHVAGFDGAGHDPQLFERVPDALERLRPITVCALAGSVYGGATDLVLACDLRVALAGSEWRMPANALGLHYYPSGLRRYVTRLGLNLAKRAFLTAQTLPIETLNQVPGLFEAIVDADDFDAALNSLVGTLTTLAPLSLQATKQSLNEIAAGDYDLRRLRERESSTTQSADFAEGRAAFAKRRVPTFSGR